MKRPRGRTLNRGVLVVVGVMFALLVIMAASIPFAGERESMLMTEDRSWKGLSKFYQDLVDLEDYMGNVEVSRIEHSAVFLNSVEKPGESLYIIVGLERMPSYEEAEAVLQFLNSGGSIIIADDFGYANSLFELMGSVDSLTGSLNPGTYTGLYSRMSDYIQISQGQLVDHNYQDSPSLVRIDACLGGHHLLLNAPAAIKSLNGSTQSEDWDVSSTEIVAMSSSMSWIDDNWDFERDPGESEGPFAVGAKYLNALVISDSGLFTNMMYEKKGNRDFLLGYIIETMDRGGTILVDESFHLKRNPAENGLSLVIQTVSNLTQNVCLILPLTIIIFIAGMVFVSRAKLLPIRPHTHELHSKRLSSLANKELGWGDWHWLRDIFLDHFGRTYDLKRTGVRGLVPEDMLELIGDGELFEMLFTPPQDTDFEAMAEKMLKWKPVEKYSGMAPEDILLALVKERKGGDGPR